MGVDSDTSRRWRVLRWEKTDRIRFMLRKVTLAAAEAGSSTHEENIPEAQEGGDMVVEGSGSRSGIKWQDFQVHSV